MSAVFMFPGQGSQFVGMGREVYDNFAVSRDVFHEVDETLGRSLSKIIFYGPEEELTVTTNAQLALMTVSVATVRALEHECGKKLKDMAEYVVGHSVGEYSALCVAGVLDLVRTTRLLDVRSRAMQDASSCMGGMMALVGADIHGVETVVSKASEYGICEIANDNCEGQVVVSGVNEALDAIPVLMRGTGIKRAIRLKVSGPFHSSLMKKAYEELRDFVATSVFNMPEIRIVFNVSASEHECCDEIKDLVVRQVISRVRWRETMTYLLGAGCSRFIEVGPGEVLTGLLRRIDQSACRMNVNTIESLNGLFELIKNP